MSVSVIQVIAILITTILIDTNNLTFPNKIVITNQALDQKGHYFNLNLTVFAGLIPLLICGVLLSSPKGRINTAAEKWITVPAAAGVATYNILCVIPVTISAVTFSYEDNCYELSVFNIVNYTLFPLIILLLFVEDCMWFPSSLVTALSFTNIVVGAVFILSKYDILKFCSYPSLIYSVLFYTLDVIMFIVSFCFARLKCSVGNIIF